MELTELPEHAGLVAALTDLIDTESRWRWLELGCSLGAGRGDAWSDVDVAVGYDSSVEDVRAVGAGLVDAIGETIDALVHTEAGWPEGIVRLAAEYASGVQLDLVLMPANRRTGLPPGSVALVDKDGRLAEPWTPEAYGADPHLTREWTMLGWWSISNVAKYVARGTLHEAVEALSEARNHLLRVYAASRGIAYPSFGLTSLLDFEPFQLPRGVDDTYAVPADPHAMLQAATAVADLLAVSAREAGARLGVDLETPWQTVARERLSAATADVGS